MKTQFTAKKKNIVIAIAAVCVLVIGASFAYFVDHSKVTNSFTVGDIEVEVSEPNWNPEEGKDITPNKVIKKDPLVTNTGVNDAYAFVSVKVPKANVTTVTANGALNEKKVQDLFTYKVNNNWKLIKTNDGTDHTEYVYGYVGDNGNMKVLKKGEKTNPVFDSVQFINIVDEQIDGQNLDIDVDAMGIQTADLGTTSPLEMYNIIVNQSKTNAPN